MSGDQRRVTHVRLHRVARLCDLKIPHVTGGSGIFADLQNQLVSSQAHLLIAQIEAHADNEYLGDQQRQGGQQHKADLQTVLQLHFFSSNT